MYLTIKGVNELMAVDVKEEILQQTIDRFWETIPPTWHRIRSNIQSIVTEHFDITVEQYHVLRLIRRGIHSASELAEAKQISRPAISQAVDNMVGKGWITRTQSTTDRRCVQLELTESGNNLLNAIFQKNREWMMGKLETLSPEELANLIRAMGVLKEAFSENSEETLTGK
jgi:DNA-binding MarR family transcriptional regulator